MIEEDTKVIDANIPHSDYTTRVFSEVYFAGVTPSMARSDDLALELSSSLSEQFGWDPALLTITVNDAKSSVRRLLGSEAAADGTVMDVIVQATSTAKGAAMWDRWVETKRNPKNLEKKLVKNLRDTERKVDNELVPAKDALADAVESSVLTIPEMPRIVSARKENADTLAIATTDAKGEKYSRFLQATFEITGYTLEDYQNTIQYIFLVNLAEEINADPKAVIIESFTYVGEKHLLFDCKVRATQNEVKVLPFCS